jgi:hypothetical protein
MMRTRSVRQPLIIARRPDVAWYVGGRVMFEKHIPLKIRLSWKVGKYGVLRVLNLRRGR